MNEVQLTLEGKITEEYKKRINYLIVNVDVVIIENWADSRSEALEKLRKVRWSCENDLVPYNPDAFVLFKREEEEECGQKK